jgi:hypothetical protein
VVGLGRAEAVDLAQVAHVAGDDAALGGLDPADLGGGAFEALGGVLDAETGVLPELSEPAGELAAAQSGVGFGQRLSPPRAAGGDRVPGDLPDGR